jgi:two-component system, OmpR family, sensor kinase
MTGWRPRRWGHWTLRSRLVVAIAVLAAVALLVVDTVGLALLRSSLTRRVDDQLTAISSVPLQRWENRPPPEDPTSQQQQQSNPFRGPIRIDQVRYQFDAQGNEERSLRQLTVTDLSPPRLGSFAQLKAKVGDEPFTVDAQNGSDRWRMLVVDGPGGGLVVLGASMQDIDATADQLLVIDAAVTGLMLLLIGVIAAWLVRLGLRPLTRMEGAAAEITAGDLSRRVEDADPHTEPGRLGIALNSMLGRIESEVAARTASEQRLRQFVADASHELRTPLTSIRGFAELYRRGGAPPGELLDETMSRIESEAARMGLLVDDLLLLARLDLSRPMDRRRVDLLAIAADTIRDAHARAPERAIRLSGLDEQSDTFEPVTVLGDEHRLRQVATNLVSNALQHTPDQAQITVRVGRWDAWRQRLAPPAVAAVGDPLVVNSAAVLEVSDNGPGVPVDHAPRVFERLYRVDPSRTRTQGRPGGSGLGLSIVAAIVHSHGGRVELVTGAGRGSTFRVLLPVDSSELALR